MFNRFTQIFWGLLFVILDVKVNRVDVLPDFLGYILIALGCGGLASVSRRFNTAQTLSWVLAGLGVLSYVSIPGDAATFFSLARLAVDCAMMWFLLGGVMDLAADRQHPDLFSRASGCRGAYIVLLCVSTTAGLFVKGPRDVMATVVVGTVVCLLVVLFLILHLFHQIKRELS